MRFVIENSFARLSGASDEEIAFVVDALTFTTERWLPHRRHFVRDRACLLDRATLSMPIGVVPQTMALCAEHGHRVETTIDRHRPGATPNLAIFNDLLFTPYDFQTEAATRALTESIGVIKSPPGSGKTFVAVMIMAATQDINWVVFCPNDNLADQMADTYRRNLEEEPGMVKAGKFKPGRVTIVTFSQARVKEAQLKDVFERAQGIIVDEVHGGGGETHLKAIMACTGTYYRIGLSATPLDRGDRKNILVVAAAGPQIYEVPQQALIAREIVAKPDMYMLRYRHGLMPERVMKLVEHAAIYRARIVNNHERNELVVRVAELLPKPLLIFVIRREHVWLLVDMLKSAGVGSVEGVDEKTHPERRLGYLASMNRGRLDVCVAGKVFQDGVDCPGLASVFNAAGYKSVIAALQRLGRGGRITATKKGFPFVDVGDYGDYGERHTRARDDAYTREGFEMKYVGLEELEAILANAPDEKKLEEFDFEWEEEPAKVPPELKQPPEPKLTELVFEDLFERL